MRDLGMTVKTRPALMFSWLLGGLPWLAVGAVPVRAEAAEAEEVQSSIEFAPDDPVDMPPPQATPPAAPAKADDGEPPLLQSRRKYDTKDSNGKTAAQKPGYSLRGQQPSERPESLFGTYRMRLSYGVPKFNDHLKGYKEAYGSPNGYPEFGADWFAWDWYATLGIGIRMGYYTANGHAFQGKGNADTSGPAKDLDVNSLQIDANGPTSLTLIPLKLLATAEFTPFRRKYIVFDGWAGYERLYFQEVRKSTVTATSTTPTTTPTTTGTGTTTTQPVDTSLVNRGWINSTVVGVAANILLNPIDQETSYAAHTGMGIGSIYLTGYLEWIRAVNRGPGHLSFGRTVTGIAFTFETSN